MPEFHKDAPRRDVEVKGLKLTLPEAFVVGHALTANEAKFLNDRLQSVMVNGYGGDIRRTLEAIDKTREEAHAKGEYKGPWAVKDGKEVHPRTPAEATLADLPKTDVWADHQGNLDRKFAAYQVGGDNGRGEITAADPVERIARDIAVREVKELLIKRGKKVKEAMDAKDPANAKRSMFLKYVDDRLNGSQRERIMALAKVQVEGMNDDDEDEQSFDDLPSGEATEAGAQAA